MERRPSDDPMMSVAIQPPKDTYETPRLTMHGTVHELTQNPGGVSADGFGGSAPII
jgi:hypothetical protein